MVVFVRKVRKMENKCVCLSEEKDCVTGMKNSFEILRKKVFWGYNFIRFWRKSDLFAFLSFKEMLLRRTILSIDCS